MVSRRYEIYLRVFKSISRDIGFEHEKINFISPRNHVLFFLLYKPTNYDVFDDFPKISDHFRPFPKIFKMLSEGCTNVSEHFPRISEVFRRLPKIAEDCRGRSEDFST